MDTELFRKVLQGFLRTDITSFGEDESKKTREEVLGNFEKKYCYHPLLQPLYTVEVLSNLLDSFEENVILHAKDRIGTELCLFKAGEVSFILGPYLSSSFNETKVMNALMAEHLPAAWEGSIRLYTAAFPVVSSITVRHAVTSCLQAFTGSTAEYLFRDVERTEDAPSSLHQGDYTRAIDYSTLRIHYERENRFLNMIEMGDTANVISAYRAMNISGMGKERYISATYQEPAIALAMTRALSRKAAERGGADIVEINEITQRATQKIHRLTHMREQNAAAEEMILELTEAVRRKRLMTQKYSEPVRDAVTFLWHNYSQKISMNELARNTGLSESALSRRFHRETGMTVSRYIAHIRCEEAARLLDTTQHSVQDISAYVGYEDSNYFVKVFRRQYKETPTAWRKGRRDREGR